MSHFYSIEFNGTEGPTPGVEERIKSTASMFYQVLPTVVQSRMPMLPSIRHSLNDFRTRGMHSKQNSMSDISLPGTPPPGYTSRGGSGTTTPQQYTSLTSIPVPGPEDDGCDTSLAQATHQLPTVAQEGSTGISWQHARHGIVGINEAYRQAMAPSCGQDDVMPDIVRTQYVHSMALLLKSLPPALTPAEQLNLLASIPQSIMEKDGQALVPMSPLGSSQQEARSRSLLWQITAWLVFNLFVVVQMMAPYVKQTLRHAAQWEQEHQLARSALNTSIALGGRLSRRVTEAVWRMQDGAAGEVLIKALVYCADGIAGGLQQGLAEASKARQDGLRTDLATM